MRSLTFALAASVAAVAHTNAVAGFDYAQRALADNATCTIETNTDYFANDVGNVLASSYTLCCDFCQSNANCTAWSWSDYNDGTCWLKSRIGRRSSPTGVIAGYLPNAPTAPPVTPRPTNPNDPKCTIHQDMDFEDYDIGSVQADLSDDCCGLCHEHTNCTVWSWNTANGGTCWLKSMAGPMYIKSGNVAGTLPNAPTEPPAVIHPMTPRPTTDRPLPSNHVQWKLRAGVVPLRACTLGGWLVAEHWMTYKSPAWDGVNYTTASRGEYYTMLALGKERGTKQFEAHRSMWITEKDIEEIAAAGINAVRVPIGFWIINDDPAIKGNEITEVYAPGALKYLDALVNGWAVKYNIAVLLSLHAHQGSQNGNDHSAPQQIGETLWANSTKNVKNSLQFATYIAERYHHSEAFLGLGLINEPSGTTPYSVLLEYYKKAYQHIRRTGNDCIIAMSPLLSDQKPPALLKFMDYMNSHKYDKVIGEIHNYYQWGYEGRNETSIIEAAGEYRGRVLEKWVSANPLFIGEWSLGTTFSSSPFKDRALQKQFAQTQLDSYVGATAGWSFWAWRNDQELNSTKNGDILLGWSMRQLLRDGIFTVPKAQ